MPPASADDSGSAQASATPEAMISVWIRITRDPLQQISRMSRQKLAPDLIRGGCRFADKDMR
jgi:hypothetical protein